MSVRGAVDSSSGSRDQSGADLSAKNVNFSWLVEDSGNQIGLASVVVHDVPPLHG